MYIGLRPVKRRLFWSDFHQIWIFSTDFLKKKKSDFIKIRPVGAEFVLCGRADMTKLIVAFRNFVNALEHDLSHIYLLLRSIAGNIVWLIPAVSQSFQFQLLYCTTKELPLQSTLVLRPLPNFTTSYFALSRFRFNALWLVYLHLFVSIFYSAYIFLFAPFLFTPTL